MFDKFSDEALAAMTPEELRKAVHDLVVLQMVMDATLSLLVATAGGVDALPDLIKPQVEAACSACLEITGEPSLIGFSRFNTER